MEELNLDDLACIAGLDMNGHEVTPLMAYRRGSFEPPFTSGIIRCEPGDIFDLIYDDGRNERTVRVAID